jgi:hypothetical protein
MSGGCTSCCKMAARFRSRSGGTPRLLRATPEERNNWEILPFGDALHWPDIDEDLDVRGFLIGAKAPGATPPVEA